MRRQSRRKGESNSPVLLCANVLPESLVDSGDIKEKTKLFCSFEDEKPLQLYQLGADSVQCFRVQPAENLQPYIYYYWWLAVAPGDTTIEVIPDNAIDLVMSPAIRDLSILYLPASEKFTIPLSGPITYIGISFRAEMAAAFFNLDYEAMATCKPGADTTEILGVDEMVNGVQQLEHPENLAGMLDRLAFERLHAPLETIPRAVRLDVSKALAAMQGSVGSHGMKSLAGNFGLSDRQFRRIMSSLFGYGPKKIQRVMRLQASLKEILNSDPLTLEDGFYDESHKIKEIHSLTGLTPGEIRKMAEIYNQMD